MECWFCICDGCFSVKICRLHWVSEMRCLGESGLLKGGICASVPSDNWLHLLRAQSPPPQGKLEHTAKPAAAALCVYLWDDSCGKPSACWPCTPVAPIVGSEKLVRKSIFPGSKFQITFSYSVPNLSQVSWPAHLPLRDDDVYSSCFSALWFDPWWKSCCRPKKPVGKDQSVWKDFV